MARTSYDDWNFMGEVQEPDRRIRVARTARSQQVNSQRNSFIFLCVVILLTFMGLVCIYSASYETAVSKGLPHYSYLLRQGIYVLIGIALAVFINLVPEGVLKVLSPVLFFGSIIALAVDLILRRQLLLTPDTVNILFLSCVMYLSQYFASRGNSLSSAKQYIPPILGCVLVLAMILFRRNFSYAAMFLALSLTMFATGGVGLFGIIMIILYVSVPVVCMVLSKSERILEIASFLIPGLGSGARTEEVMVIKSAVSSGAWFGKGLGGGLFKSGQISDIVGRNIFACICEELGFWGVVMIVLFIAFYAFVGYSAARRIRRQNGFYSNLATGITTLVVWQFILNVLWVLGVVPTDGLPMPFFSFGIGIIPILFESGILYRITREKLSGEENGKVLESIQEELMFPEIYDFEKT